jgi:hypothetical protein
MMNQVCFLLGQAAGKQGAAPDTDSIEKPEWQRAYMRGYERGERERRRRAKEQAK